MPFKQLNAWESRRLPLAERIWSGAVENEAGCWVWKRSGVPEGYGRLWVNGKQKLAHRAAWEECRGPIPDGLFLDHLCRNRRCIRPDHLEPVTHRENVVRGSGTSAINAAKTHCIHGHEFTEENTRHWRGSRICRACRWNTHHASRAAP